MRILLVLAVACSGSSPAPTRTTSIPPETAHVPTTTMVAEIGKSLQWISIDGYQVQVTHSVDLPAPIKTLEWSQHQPVLLLDGDLVVAVDGSYRLERIALPPAATWSRPAPKPDLTHLKTPTTRLVTKGDEVWLGRCEWLENVGLFDSCAEWVNVRIRPLPIVTETSHEMESYDNITLDTPKIPVPPSSAINARLVPDKDRHEGRSAKLVCTDGGTTVEDPPAGTTVEPQFDTNGEGGRSDLIWLSTEPPIFRLADWDHCRPCPSMVLFERCQRSKRFDGVAFGPNGLFAFTTPEHVGDNETWSSTVVLFRNGRELGRIKHVTRFQFVY